MRQGWVRSRDRSVPSGTSPAGSARSPGASLGKQRRNFRRALRQVGRRRDPQKPWLSGRNAGAGWNSNKNGLAAQAGPQAIFRVSIARTRAKRSLARRAGRAISGHFRFSEGISDFRTNFRRVSAGGRCLTMGHKCLIVRHAKYLSGMAFRAWVVERRISGSFLGHLCLIARVQF